jgi:hypothetical protein
MKLLDKIFLSLSVFVMTDSAVFAAPYTFTAQDYIDYGIFFSPRGADESRRLLTLRAGDINGYYAKFFPSIEDVPSQRQSLELRTPRGSVRVRRSDNEGLVVIRDTHNSRRRQGTKRLEVTFERGICTDADGNSSPCAVHLRLTTNRPDIGTVRQSRTLRITTSTGLSFRYKSLFTDGGKPLNLPALNRSPSIVNFASEWRRSIE